MKLLEAIGYIAVTLFYFATGGRPMHRYEQILYDPIAKKTVYRFVDALGRHWMAFNPWSLFRVKIPKHFPRDFYRREE
jgi:hypothetical protein